MKVSEIRKKTSAELQKELTELSKELFKLRMQKGVGQAAKPHTFKKARRMIARIKTILNEKAKAI